MQELHNKLPFLHEYGEILLKDTIILNLYVPLLLFTQELIF